MCNLSVYRNFLITRVRGNSDRIVRGRITIETQKRDREIITSEPSRPKDESSPRARASRNAPTKLFLVIKPDADPIPGSSAVPDYQKVANKICLNTNCWSYHFKFYLPFSEVIFNMLNS